MILGLCYAKIFTIFDENALIKPHCSKLLKFLRFETP